MERTETSVATFKNKSGKVIKLPQQVFLCRYKSAASSAPIPFFREKKSGKVPGAIYMGDDKKAYLVKFPGKNLFVEKLSNDLARIAIKKDGKPSKIVTDESLICYGSLDDEPSFGIANRMIPRYQDVSQLGNFASYYRPDFHQSYAFNCLMTNDDLHDQNLGIAERETDKEHPAIADLGIYPHFLYPAQEKYKAIVFHLASFIGHNNPVGMNLNRRQYFGDSDFLNPLRKHRSKKAKDSDISYYSILSGIKDIVDSKDELFMTIKKTLKEVQQINETTKLPAKYMEFATTYFSDMGDILKLRIDWLSENFEHDLKLIGVKAKEMEFKGTKWRHTEKFHKLLQTEREISEEIAKYIYKENLREIGAILQVDRDGIFTLDFATIPAEKMGALKQEIANKFILHNAVMNNDAAMVGWLLDNNLADINQTYFSRECNYQHLHQTPLGIAVTISLDKLVSQKGQDVSREVMEKLRAAFVAKNVSAESKKERSVDETSRAFDFYVTKRDEVTKQAATIIQGNYRSHSFRNKLEKARAEGLAVGALDPKTRD
jgi:hypothetical protein